MMVLGEAALSVEARLRILICLLYLTTFLLVYWRLFPGLSATARRLASLMLVAQVLIIAASLYFRPVTSYEWWIYSLNQEWNIPAALSATQLTLVGAVALATSWLARSRPAAHRLYLAGIALVFVFLARDESFGVHEGIRDWMVYYAALGAFVVGTTLMVAARSPRRVRIWHVCLLTGLAMTAAGAMGIESLRFEEICRGLGFWHNDVCQIYYIEESLEFLGIWLTLIAVLGQFSDVAPTPPFAARIMLYVIPVIVFSQLVYYSPKIHDEIARFYRELTLIPLRLEYHILAQPAFVDYESDVGLRAYRIVDEDETFAVELFASSIRKSDLFGLGYSVHLVDQVTGASIAGSDKSATHWLSWRINIDFERRQYLWMHKQRIEVELPPEAPDNRALWVVITTWRREGDDYERQNIISSDHQQLDDTQVILGELVLPAESSASAADQLAVFDNGFALGKVDLPSNARPGSTLNLNFAWRADDTGREDYTQFLHFYHADSGATWGFDQQPLGTRLPTRLWYSGLVDSENWEIVLPDELAPGQYNVFTGLYRTSDLERLPANDADGRNMVDALVPLGSLTIEAP